MVRDLLDVIIDSVVNLHSGNTEKLPIIVSPLSTTATAVNVATAAILSQDSSVPVSTVWVGNDGNTRATRIILEIPAHVPMSEEIGEQLFLQGYDSDVILPCYYPETDMQILDNYSSVAIGKEFKGDDIEHEAPATAEPQFVLITDTYIKNLEVDDLLRELKERGLTTGGLKKYLKERIEKSIVNKVSVASYISEEAATPLVFGEVVRWKKIMQLEEPVFDPTVST